MRATGRSSLGSVTDGANGRLVGGRYRLGPHVGSGGMGTVFRAIDELLHREVAVKEIPIPQGLPAAESERLRERYLREARAAARLRHAGVVGVYDVLPEPDRVWIVMEYVKARNLAEILRQDGPLSPERAAGLGQQLLDALEHAHRAGVLHRDVKPANVLVCDEPGEQHDRAVLTDFGVASVSGDASLTRTGHLVGSPAYLSPERLTGGTVGPPSDLWSLGCTLFAAVEGRAPFARDEQFAVITAITLEPVPLATRAGNLAPILTGLLDKDPEQRWEAIRTRTALRRVADGFAVEQLSATSWGSQPVAGDRPTWWMPPDRPPVAAHPTAGRPASGHPAVGRPMPSARPPGWQGQTSVGYSSVSAPPAPSPQPNTRSGSRVGLWLLAAVLVVLLAGSAGVIAKKYGWLDLSGSATPQPTSGGAPTPTLSATVYSSTGYELRYPATWNAFCVTDPAEIEAQGHRGCYFDQLTADKHTDANTELRRSPYVLVIVGTAKGTALEQLTAEEAAARKLNAFPGYARVRMSDYTYGEHEGAVLEFTHTGKVITQPHRIRIFRFVNGDTFYEISLRAPEASYDDYLPGFELIAGSIEPL